MQHSGEFRLIDSLNSPKKQGGATAIEFAIAFPVFFALLYAILTYGFIFLTQMGLQHAAEDGARAVLRHPGLVDTAAGETELGLRRDYARTITSQQIAWIPTTPTAQANISVDICAIITPNCAVNPDPSCTLANAYTTRCQVVVTVTYPYRANPIVPPLPGFAWIIPAQLQGSARVLLDGRALSVL